MATLSLQQVVKRFDGRAGQVEALREVSLEIGEGEFVVLVGPSGCGKSTLLNIIAGLDPADSGTVLENGSPVAGPGRDRSVVFQEGALFPWLTARKNVEFGLKQRGLSRRERKTQAQHYLEMVHLGRFGNSFPHELSGGMRQRVAIARALALEPEVLLMDEPFSALDAQTREDLYHQLVEVWERTRKTVVFVTHNVREAVCLGDRVVLMAPRPGRVKAVFRVQLARPRYPDDPDVARMARRISEAMKDDRELVRSEEYDEDWHPAQDPVLLSPDTVLGDHI